MLEEICAEIKNWFTYRSDIYIGDYEITDGVISPSVDFKEAEYIRILGSRKNAGVHKLNTETGLFDLEDESSFHGSIWLMSPPRDFLALCRCIESWQKQYGSADSAAMSPYQSESFGGYSYTKASGSASGESQYPTWQKMYADQLRRWRRIRDL
jgi:hypothetical protein